MIEEHFGIVVIGAGMAGASIAAHLAEHLPVLLVEMEPQAGYHSTGRSAARFSEAYGNAAIRSLSRASRLFFFAPPEGFCDVPLVAPRPDLTFASTSQVDLLDAYAESVGPTTDLERLTPRETIARYPLLRPEDLGGGILDRSPADIDVHALHQGYLRMFRARAGRLATGAQVLGLERRSDRWRVRTADALSSAPIVVNAAGAWAGQIGEMAGAHAIGLQPRRRTALILEPPPATAVASWPMLNAVDESFYLKPEAGRLLLSPADETPVPPSDVQPDDLDVAIAIDRVETATTLKVPRIVRKWAGLRSFVEDRSPCVGFDPGLAGFFWLAALGGYGIQTAPALSRLAADLVLARPVDARLDAFGVEPAALAPSRLQQNLACTGILKG